jgi:hypothetical protein
MKVFLALLSSVSASLLSASTLSDSASAFSIRSSTESSSNCNTGLELKKCKRAYWTEEIGNISNANCLICNVVLA